MESQDVDFNCWGHQLFKVIEMIEVQPLMFGFHD